MNDGRKIDVLIEDQYLTDPRTGVESLWETHLIVWADAGMKDVIATIPGIIAVYQSHYTTCYEVSLDPRYDRDYLKAEIEAALRCS